LEVFLRPVKISDEPLLKEFFYSLTENSLYRRFISVRKDIPHERLQEFIIIDYTRQMVILAVMQKGEREEVIGVGQYAMDEVTHMAEVGFAVRDNSQNKGIGSEMLAYLTFLAKKQGLLGFYAEVLVENRPMLHLFNKLEFDIEKRREEGVYELKILFR
jgi:RimJ/RimL family protein N-acetyltransferase